jgi:putative ABC transport system permease protein
MSDLRDAFRTLRATPIVTIVAVLSLALGIGANTAIFSIVDTLLLRALPVKDPDRLALIMRGEEAVFSSWTNPIWEQVRTRRDFFETAFAVGSWR